MPQGLALYCFIAAGGATGACLRYFVTTSVDSLFGKHMPFGTLTVNVVGCLLIGLVAGLIDDKQIGGGELRAFVLIGILGGFTTYSAFGYETINLIRDGNISAAIVNIATQIVLGLGAVWIGYKLATVA